MWNYLPKKIYIDGKINWQIFVEIHEYNKQIAKQFIK